MKSGDYMDRESISNKITPDSKIGELYATPVGHDTLAKVLLQVGLPEKIITNGLVSNLRLKTIAKLTSKKLGTGFFETLLHLVNSEPDVPVVSKGAITRKWWKEAVFYQIYPLGATGAPYENNGVLEHRILQIRDWIPHLKKLGIGAVYFSPVFESDTHGYNTRDYRRIDCRLGTNEDFRQVCDALHDAGIKVVLDGVFNHAGRGFFADGHMHIGNADCVHAVNEGLLIAQQFHEGGSEHIACGAHIAFYIKGFHSLMLSI
jgi:hypothetical protein